MYQKLKSSIELISLLQGIVGYICGSDGLDSSGLSSSAAVSIYSFFFFFFLILDASFCILTASKLVDC